MPNILTSGSVQKSHGDIVRLPMDFGDLPQLIAEAYLDDDDNLVMPIQISTFNVVCNAQDTDTAPNPVIVSALQLDYPYQVSAKFGSGEAGFLYDAIYSIVLDDGDATNVRRTGQLEVV